MRKFFILCTVLVLGVLSLDAQVQVARSYLNLSKPLGGPVSVGDVLEIRAVIAVPAADTIDRLRYREIIPAGLAYQPNSLRAITNEGTFGGGILNTGVYTDLANDDPGTFVTGNTVHINLGQSTGNSTASTSGGTIYGGVTRPTFYGVNTIVQAAYRVTVTAATLSVITISGTFLYRSLESGAALTVINNLPNRSITVMPVLSCSTPGTINLITDETGGTFSQGTAHSRGPSPNAVGFINTTVTSGTPQDGQYSVAKNTSPTEYTGGSPVSSDRVFTVWDILGDHTGTNNAIGNPPSASGVNGGYMLVVNATYAPSSIFTTSITGLSTNTIYTMSFWVRNICPQCGANPNGGGSGTPGVKPNLAFDVNGTDLYTTGEMTYTGLWEQKSFTFNSGALTSANVTIRNNAPGGGGNDWALDDIQLSACLVLLPVNLSRFYGREDNGNVYLNWEIGASSNPRSFVVEYSGDGRNFQEVGEVQATSATAYSFEERRQKTGLMYYRLKMNDQQGQAQYSPVVTIKADASTTGSIKIVPNPSNGTAYLQLESASQTSATVVVRDYTGKTVTSFRENIHQGINQIALIRGQRLNPGMYIVQVSAAEANWQEKWIVR